MLALSLFLCHSWYIFALAGRKRCHNTVKCEDNTLVREIEVTKVQVEQPLILFWSHWSSLNLLLTGKKINIFQTLCMKYRGINYLVIKINFISKLTTEIWYVHHKNKIVSYTRKNSCWKLYLEFLVPFLSSLLSLSAKAGCLFNLEYFNFNKSPTSSRISKA